MLGLAIKNTILIILIILIIHFLIKTFTKTEEFMNDCASDAHLKFPAPQTSQTTVEPAPFVPEKPVECEQPVPITGTTCDPALKPLATETKTVKSECVLDQPNPNAFVLLKEYDNENLMNAGRWENIDLYDEFGSVYMEYS